MLLSIYFPFSRVKRCFSLVCQMMTYIFPFSEFDTVSVENIKWWHIFSCFQSLTLFRLRTSNDDIYFPVFTVWHCFGWEHQMMTYIFLFSQFDTVSVEYVKWWHIFPVTRVWHRFSWVREMMTYIFPYSGFNTTTYIFLFPGFNAVSV